MGNVSTSQMAIVSDSRRLSSPIPITAIFMEDKANGMIITGPRSNHFSNRKILDSRDYQSLADSKRELSVQLLYDPGTNEEKTNFRLFPTQPLLTISTLQDGRCSSSKADHRERRPDVQSGSQGCICSSANTPSTPTIFNLQTPGSGLSVQVNGVWPQRCPQSVHQDNALCIRTITKERDQICVLFGRHLCFGKNQRENDSNNVINYKTFDQTRFSHQLGEKCSHPQPYPRIPWLCLQHQDVNFGFCAEITEIDDQTEANIEPSSSTTIMQMDSESSGEDDGDDPSKRRSITTPEIHAKRSSKIITLHHQTWEAPCHLSHESQEELRWWKDFASTRNGLDIQKPAERNPDLTIHCDASDLGWGV
ncbi:hypothetical protein G6F42_013791 [Rhizopus arrhizus]|nr:hypothetical protein G6F42_013791 [Rhizopus arrhizus]